VGSEFGQACAGSVVLGVRQLRGRWRARARCSAQLGAGVSRCVGTGAERRKRLGEAQPVSVLCLAILSGEGQRRVVSTG
jgi:hypothetical protein